MFTPKELFQQAGIAMQGPVPWKTRVADTPSGVYVIALADPQGASIEHLNEDERARWNSGQAIVYIGRATSVQKRLQQFYQHEYGRSSPHKGGQSILLLQCPLLVYWGQTPDFIAAEHRMIEAFREAVGTLPYANRTKSAQPRDL